MTARTQSGSVTAPVLSAAAFGPNIRARRKALGWTQQELAALAGIALNYPALIESGQRTGSIDTILAICEALFIGLDEAFTPVPQCAACQDFPPSGFTCNQCEARAAEESGSTPAATDPERLSLLAGEG